MVSAFSAFILITGHQLPIGLTLAWVFFLAVLGVTMCHPDKAADDQYRAVALSQRGRRGQTLRALHSHGEKGLRAFGCATFQPSVFL